MLFRILPAAALVLFVLSGCKSGSLAARDASVALDAGVFATPNAVQTLSFTSGDASSAKIDALNGYLYAKRWLTCKTIQPGLFSRTSVCTLNTVGRTYAHENGWTAAHPAGACEQCEVWTVPLARAKLTGVSDVSASDKSHAVATYAYAVVPDAFGAGLADWMSSNPVAWCGPDPRASGAWTQTRAGKASFARTGRSWSISPAPPSGFAANFAAPAAERPCTSP